MEQNLVKHILNIARKNITNRRQHEKQKTKTFLSLPVKENIIDIPILEKIGFKKIPSDDGFVMYELTPSRLNQQKEKA
jgi:hypothetical protein